MGIGEFIISTYFVQKLYFVAKNLFHKDAIILKLVITSS